MAEAYAHLAVSGAVRKQPEEGVSVRQSCNTNPRSTQLLAPGDQGRPLTLNVDVSHAAGKTRYQPSA